MLIPEDVHTLLNKVEVVFEGSIVGDYTSIVHYIE